MNLKKFCATLTLVSVLATSALAGGIETGDFAPPTAPAAAPTPTSSTQSTSTTSETTGDETSAADVSVTEAVITAVGAALALL